jgi:hypothetical protein
MAGTLELSGVCIEVDRTGEVRAVLTEGSKLVVSQAQQNVRGIIDRMTEKFVGANTEFIDACDGDACGLTGRLGSPEPANGSGECCEEERNRTQTQNLREFSPRDTAVLVGTNREVSFPARIDPARHFCLRRT